MGSGDVFVAKLDLVNNVVDYSTYVAGSDIDFVKSLVINDYGEAHILGATRSDNWPVTPNSSGHSDQYDLFVTILSADGSSLVDSELFGGSYNDYPRASGSMRYIDDRVIVAATTHSGDIPLTGVTYQTNKTNGLADSPWIGSISIDVTLPVELNAFDAAWDEANQQVNMEWLVYEGEVKEGGTYIVERLAAGNGWEEIYHQELEISEEWVNLYTYQDVGAKSFEGQELAYRIKYQGLDGEIQYSLSQSLIIPRNTFKSFVVHPNPTSDFLQVEVELEEEESQIGVALYDLMGRIVLTDNLESQDGNFTISRQYDLSSLSAGIYHLAVWDSHGQQMVKNIVKK